MSCQLAGASIADSLSTRTRCGGVEEGALAIRCTFRLTTRPLITAGAGTKVDVVVADTRDGTAATRGTTTATTTTAVDVPSLLAIVNLDADGAAVGRDSVDCSSDLVTLAATAVIACAFDEARRHALAISIRAAFAAHPAHGASMQ